MSHCVKQTVLPDCHVNLHAMFDFNKGLQRGKGVTGIPGLSLATPLYGGQFTLSTQLIKPNHS